MKRIFIIFLALALAACGAPPATTEAPTAAPPEPTQTPFVIVETFVVTVIPTNAPTEVPAATPLPPPTEPAAATQPPAEVTQPPAPAAADTGAPVTIDDALGAGWFVSMISNRSDFSLRCQFNKEITFSVKATNPDITQVDFWYRFEDRSNGAVFEWVNAGKMIPDNAGNFTLTLSGDQVSPNFRKPNSWFDFQFIGYNATGVVGRSEKIERQVTYTFDCP